MQETDKSDLTALTVQLLSAYVANNSLPSNELASLIETTRNALAGKVEAPAPEAPEFVPAVSVRKSTASRDHLISLIDGKSYRSLKRHLTSHGLTPDEYRERYKLPKDYPMVAPSYSEQRRAVAQRLGLGRKPKAAKAAAEPVATKQVAPRKKPATARKPRKAAAAESA